MKKTLAIASAALLLAAPSWSAEKPEPAPPKNGPEVVELKSATMPLKFPHKKHQTLLKIECAACHQPGSAKKEAWNATAAHKVCLKCHMDKGAGVKECTGCHKLK